MTVMDAPLTTRNACRRYPRSGCGRCGKRDRRMSAAERTKGRNAERDVRALYEAAGFTVRGLEGGGDHLCIRDGLVIHSEVKRQETLRLPLWARQAYAEAAPSTVPVVAYRRNNEPWRALLPERDLPRATAAQLLAGVDYTVVMLNDSAWAQLPLADLLAVLR